MYDYFNATQNNPIVPFDSLANDKPSRLVSLNWFQQLMADMGSNVYYDAYNNSIGI